MEKLKPGDIVRVWDNSDEHYWIRTYREGNKAHPRGIPLSVWDNIELAHPSEHAWLDTAVKFPVEGRDMSHLIPPAKEPGDYKVASGDIVRVWQAGQHHYLVRKCSERGYPYTEEACGKWDYMELAHPGEYWKLNTFRRSKLADRDISHLIPEPTPQALKPMWIVYNQTTNLIHQQCETYEEALAAARELCEEDDESCQFTVLQVAAVVSKQVTVTTKVEEVGLCNTSS